MTTDMKIEKSTAYLIKQIIGQLSEADSYTTRIKEEWVRLLVERETDDEMVTEMEEDLKSVRDLLEEIQEKSLALRHISYRLKQEWLWKIAGHPEQSCYISDNNHVVYMDDKIELKGRKMERQRMKQTQKLIKQTLENPGAGVHQTNMNKNIDQDSYIEGVEELVKNLWIAESAIQCSEEGRISLLRWAARSAVGGKWASDEYIQKIVAFARTNPEHFSKEDLEILEKYGSDLNSHIFDVFKYKENKILGDIKNYIKGTYESNGSNHYVGNTGLQTVDIWRSISGPDGLRETCRNNVLKYLSRYGKKDGLNKTDLLKAIHYLLIMIYHDFFEGSLGYNSLDD